MNYKRGEKNMNEKILHINPNEIKRNELHFNIQKKNRVIVYGDKTKYDRKKLKKELKKELDM